jgi:6,7-dimethyl-8-ribityllumazine synthase
VEGVREIRGDFDASGMSFAVVVSRFHTELTQPLAQQVIEALCAMGAAAESLFVVWVPGAFETPGAVERLAADGTWNAIFALGCVVEGATSHAESIVTVATAAFCDISRRLSVPVIDGIVAAPSYALARDRCLPGEPCRAPYLAQAAVEAARVHAQLAGRGVHHG